MSPARLRVAAVGVVLSGALPFARLQAGPLSPWSGSARAYGFARLNQGDADAPAHMDLQAVRQAWNGTAPGGSAEIHGLLTRVAPRDALGRGVTTRDTLHWLDLEHDLRDQPGERITLALDRLAWERATAGSGGPRLRIGRQAVGWGTAFFFPVLDVFGPFAPEQIDRDYKAGVDAARLTSTWGMAGEVDAVAAVLGDDPDRDASCGALLRQPVGAVDLGIVGGAIHHDTVAGAFAQAERWGALFRCDAAYTWPGEEGGASSDEDPFGRLTLGADRQLTPALRVSVEFQVNGFGSSDPEDYPALASANRVARGEVQTLGRHEVAGSLGWQFHPLGEISAAAVWNADDGSVLWFPSAQWSLSDNANLIVAFLGGSGGGDVSEYGDVPAYLYGAVRYYW